MASSSSAMDNCDNYDVFLSFRGEDTRYNFTSHLHNRLRSKKNKVFIDNGIKRGEKITSALERKIEEAKISIIVFSKNYAESTFCLDELEKIMECKESKGQIVLPIFYKVEPSEATYEKAFDEHKANLGGEKTHREERIEEELKKVEKWKSAFREALKVAGWHIKEESNESDITDEITDQVSTILMKLNGSQSKGEKLMYKSMVGHKANDIFEEIWECFMNDKILRIGIYGMGGVGKTTIATRVYDELLERAKSFTHVCWVTVSKDLSIWKLQNQIAKRIELDLPEEDDKLMRAAKLREWLRSEKFVLILDDVWEAFEIKDMGIPHLVGAQKLLLTSRNRRVCERMECQPIEVESLSEQNALDLFLKESKYKISDSLEWEDIVHSIVRECAGLPLAIIVVARRMRGVVEIREWRNTLRELQMPWEGENHEMKEEVFRPLKFSYDRLSNDKVRQCFLYCSLFPEDYEISRNDLITYWIGEGIINELYSNQAELDKGHCMIEELVNAFLLEHVWGDIIKMHDVIRDMALIVIRENSKPQDGLKVLGETEICVNLESVLFINNAMLEKDVSNLPANCSRVTTLLLSSSDWEISSCFFANMQNLAVLDMREMKNFLLPDSISYLKNLRILRLYACASLEYIPSLVELKNLRHLDFSYIENLQEIPKGIEGLINLKVLKMLSVGFSNAFFPSAFLKKLSHLQILEIENVIVEAEVLISLKKLEVLRIEFYNLENLNSYFISGHWKRLQEYFIFYSPEQVFFGVHKWENEDEDKRVLRIVDLGKDFGGGKGETDMILPNNVQYLDLGCWDGPMIDVVKNSTFHNLRKLQIRRCADNQHVFTPALVQGVLLNVEELIISDQWEGVDVEEIISREEEYDSEVEGIISGEEESVGEINNYFYPTIHLPRLKNLQLWFLQDLRSIYEGRLACPSLQYIEINDCGELERLPFCMKERNILNPIQLELYHMPYQWWHSLHWDDPDANSFYQVGNYYPKENVYYHPKSFYLYQRQMMMMKQLHRDDDPSTSEDDYPSTSEDEIGLVLKG